MKAPPPLLLAALAASLPSLALGQDQGFLCDIPTNGCTNGMFNQALCECHCIPPFCADVNGDCSQMDDCGEVKWKDCTRGVNCPWWVNVLRAESCTTGPDVPEGIWDIWATREACCKKNFANSQTCDIQLSGNNESPTRHPTITALEDDIYEVIPIKFDVLGLPGDISMGELKEEMTTVLRRVLIRLSERISGLKVKEIEEKVVMNRNLEKALRALQRDVTLYYNVYVVRDDDRDFGPLIINEIRDSYDEVLDHIQTMSDTSYFGDNLRLNFCTRRSGQFDFCAGEVYRNPTVYVPAPLAPVPVPVPVPTSISIESKSVSGNGNEDGGLPGWAVAVIVITLLLLLICGGIFIFLNCCRGDGNDTKEIHNNIYMDERNRNSYMDEKSRTFEKSSQRSIPQPPRHFRQMVVSKPPKPTSLKGGDESVTIASARSKRKQGRDPTMYYPGQEDKPDPDSDLLMITDGKDIRSYYEDPPTKPKRDPTMYVEGKHSRDPSSYRDGDPPVKPKRDPTMYVEGRGDPSMYVEGRGDPSMYAEGGGDPSAYAEGQRDPTMYVEGRRDPTMYGIDEEYADNEYDSYGFKRDSAYTESSKSRGRGRRDPSYRDRAGISSDEASFQTKDPSVSSHSARRSRKKKGKGLQESQQSDWDEWGNSAPDVNGAQYTTKRNENDRQTKSFYK